MQFLREVPRLTKSNLKVWHIWLWLLSSFDIRLISVLGFTKSCRYYKQKYEDKGARSAGV